MKEQIVHLNPDFYVKQNKPGPREFTAYLNKDNAEIAFGTKLDRVIKLSKEVVGILAKELNI